MFGLFNWLKIGGVAVLGALTAAGPVYLYGKSVGRQQAAVAALETSVEILRERNEIDDKISAADAAALCGDFGLSDADKDECMRRLREASTER
jgi:hypothetical protein